MERKKYIRMQTVHTSVETENGFMSASVFDPKDEHDEGVTIEGHEIGNEGNYFDNEDPSWNTWD
ncbi:MAG: hypothetical protein IAC08_03690 [Bacteroidetes bacterium]|uniref:Uncharacterized protein n=1 Tax=Candidatus Cryptobacteroides intestinigallinarum TaxID=2840767 RepID=A0A9D9HKG2_9BACT|nr:hypothetical protein [Candidatus Cryptobacteroides intestinigallinarum]